MTFFKTTLAAACVFSISVSTAQADGPVVISEKMTIPELDANTVAAASIAALLLLAASSSSSASGSN
jgi:hypothetical protein